MTREALMTKPFTEGSTTMTARELHDAFRAGRSFRIVDVPGHPEVKIRYRRDGWPQITYVARLDVYVQDEHIVIGTPGNGLDPLSLAPEARVVVLEG